MTAVNLFKLNLCLMRFLGFYPTEKFKKLYKFYTYAVYVFFTIPVPVLAAIHLLVSENVDLVQVGDSSFIVCQMGCFIFKWIPFIFHADDVRESIRMLSQPTFNNYTEKQEKIFKDCVKVCRRNTWIFLGFCTVTFISWSLVPFCGSKHIFPVEIWIPFDATSDTRRYAASYLFIFLGVGNGAVAAGVIDPLVSGMACFAANQLKILKNNLQYLSEGAEQESRRDKNMLIYNKIKTCINHHNAILEFVDFYESVYSTLVFTQFTASVVVICVSCLQLSMVEPFTFTFFSMILFLLTMLTQIFLYSYFGSILLDESNSLTSAIYMGKWYEYDVRCKKALIILMERSKRPVIVTAGKILDLSLVTFTTILRRAYSLLAVLKSYDRNM